MPNAPLSFSAARDARWTLVAAVAFAATVFSHDLRAQSVPAAAPPGFTTLQGFVTDSIHSTPLVHASVLIEGTSRSAITDKDGHFRIDSIPAGQHRVVVLHPLLDTAGVQMRTPAYPFGSGESHDLDLAVPGGERLARALCRPAELTRGPGVMLGFVKDPDTGTPAKGANVELVYTVVDLAGRKSQTVRKGPVDSLGLYRICGIPADMSGKVQVFRNGVSSGEVPVETTNLVALRAFSIVAQHEAMAEVISDSGKVKRVARGSATATGRVVDKKGVPLSGARVMLQGGGTVTVSRANGDFTLDSLPSGTQALEIRKLGYAAADVAVELSAAKPTSTTVVLGDFVPTLQTMVVEAKRDKALSDIGYLGRKKTGMGFYMDESNHLINHNSLAFSDVMRVAPGLRIDPSGDGRTSVIRDSRSASNGCVNYYVDGTPWQSMTPGDIDEYIRPDELVAIEVYHGSSTPPEYTSPGQSGCATIVAWTVARVRLSKDKSPP